MPVSFSENTKLNVLWEVSSRRSIVDLAFANVPEFSFPLTQTGDQMTEVQLKNALNQQRILVDKSETNCENLVE